MKMLLVRALMMLGLAMPASALAQGVFDLGELTEKLGATPAAPAGQSGAAQADVDALTYTVDPARSQANVAKFIAGLKQMNADAGNQLEAGLKSVDIFAELDKALSKYGVRTTNLGDVMVAYWLSSWMGANGRTEEPTRAQIDGTRQLLAPALAATPALATMANSDKQDMAQALLMQLFFNQMMLDGLVDNPQALQAARSQIKEATKTIGGLDIDQFTLGATGLARK